MVFRDDATRDDTILELRVYQNFAHFSSENLGDYGSSDCGSPSVVGLKDCICGRNHAVYKTTTHQAITSIVSN
jgi:hypothetical protein